MFYLNNKRNQYLNLLFYFIKKVPSINDQVKQFLYIKEFKDSVKEDNV